MTGGARLADLALDELRLAEALGDLPRARRTAVLAVVARADALGVPVGDLDITLDDPPEPVRRAGKPTTVEGAWPALVNACGGVAALAALVGVEPRTVHRWGHGARITAGRAGVVRRLATERGVESPV